MVQLGDEAIKLLKVERSIFPKEQQAREYNPLASPTTPFQFEPRQPPHHNVSAFDDAAGIQSSIQLQLLNYIRSFNGVQQPAELNNLYSHQQLPGYSQPPQHVNRAGTGTGSGTAEHHPTIALLQQRFQRLERDKEMRQARQLYSNHHGCGSLEAKFSPSTSPTSSTTCSGDCNLQLSLPQGSSPGLRPNSMSSSPSGWSGCSSRVGDMPGFMSSATSMLGEVSEDVCQKTKLFLSLIPPENDRVTSKVPSYPRSSLDLSSSSSVSPYSGQSQTQTLLRDWKTGFGGKPSLPVVVDDEVDTSLHL